MSETNAQVESWKKMLTEQGERMAAMYDEMGRLEAKGLEQARTAIDEATRLMKSALDYQSQLSAEWRRLALEATRRAAETLTPKA